MRERRCSPRRRRWVGGGHDRMGHRRVLSAQAEVGRPSPRWRTTRPCALRAGGGGSSTYVAERRAAECSPRRRRWVVRGRTGRAPGCVLSAQAEVGRQLGQADHQHVRALRAGGGGSSPMPTVGAWAACSPRRRRWVALEALALVDAAVLSAQAEVGRARRPRRRPRSSALRAGGGGSFVVDQFKADLGCSPRRRRWVGGERRHLAERIVLSAQAEVGRCPCRSRRLGRCALRAGGGGAATRGIRAVRHRALRAGGGGSSPRRWLICLRLCSPRRRRWVYSGWIGVCFSTVLSAQAEVGRGSRRNSSRRGSALRAGGGGSILKLDEPPFTRCSPRRRRWVAGGRRGLDGRTVLSAQAEVGRLQQILGVRAERALRAGGGGSGFTGTPNALVRCSPHRRRWVARGHGTAGRSWCSPRRRRWVDLEEPGHAEELVLSAQAEVGRASSWRRSVPTCALRAGGGGSYWVGMDYGTVKSLRAGGGGSNSG